MASPSSKIRSYKSPTSVLREGFESGSCSRSPTGSSFAAVLTIFFTTPEKGLLDNYAIKSLRLICKAARDTIDLYVAVVSSYVEQFKLAKRHGVDLKYAHKDRNVPLIKCLLCDLSSSSWRWPNITKVSLKIPNRYDVQNELEKLVTLPLPKLKALTLECYSVMPLVRSQWPELTYLDLNVVLDRGRMCLDLNPNIFYPINLKLPKWGLKRLDLCVEGGENCGFLGLFLKGLTELEHLRVYKSEEFNYIEDEMPLCGLPMAQAIISAPLKTLTSLEITAKAVKGVGKILMEKDWSGLKEFTISDSEDCIFSRLYDITSHRQEQSHEAVYEYTFKNWVTNLQTLNVGGMHRSLLTAELRLLLLSLEAGGNMKNLTLNDLRLSEIEETF
jgi:hypothetical protein